MTNDSHRPGYRSGRRSKGAFALWRIASSQGWRIILSGAICQALLLAGCGESMPLGVATGTVRYRGETVTDGIVSFYSPELGVGREAAINSEGSFSVSRLPFGPYRIAIHPPLILQDFGGKSAPSMEPKQVGNIPEKYRNPSTSGFACDVARRSMQIDLHME